MDVLAVLESSQGVRTSVEFDDDAFRNLARAGRVDSFIVATEEGFSPLGGGLAFFSEDLGISGREIKHLADWNRFQNPKVSLVALRSRRAGSLLRGLVLAASESSESYKQFAVPRYGRPYRDFYYNVTYEAIAYVCGQWAHAASRCPTCRAVEPSTKTLQPAMQRRWLTTVMPRSPPRLIHSHLLAAAFPPSI